MTKRGERGAKLNNPSASSFLLGSRPEAPSSTVSFSHMAFFSKPQSAAVRIVKPTTEDQAVKQGTPPPRKGQSICAIRHSLRPFYMVMLNKCPDSTQRQCRNIHIYG